MNLVAATPTDAGSPSSDLIRARIAWPTSTGDAKWNRRPSTSRKASSRLRPSTYGVNDLKMSKTCSETAPYRL